MKLGILTLVPYDNYGGILQGYALQTVLERMGHDVTIMRTKLYNWVSLKNKILRFVWWVKDRYVKRKAGISCLVPGTYLDYRVARIKPFIDKHIHFTREFSSTRDLYRFQDKSQYDGFVVGSDQTWRPCLSPDLYHMFCDFLPSSSRKLRIAYAASFGVDTNEFSDVQLGICKPLIKKFQAISVREESGVKLCKDMFGVEAKHVLDPTMLLDKEDYLELIKDYHPLNEHVDLMQYMFFFNHEENAIIAKTSSLLNMKPVNLMTKYFLNQVQDKSQLPDAQFLPVEEWISAYSRAKFVLTDSFHGTVFCIIFNVPFLCVSPVAIARFKSLLKVYGLEDRLVMKESEVTKDLLEKPIDWEKVNSIREVLKKQSLDFLKKSLS